jgi:4-hydroxybenzoate polyprenyltransferase
VINDMLALGADRAQPRDRQGALASGRLSIAEGFILAATLGLAGLAAAAVYSSPLAAVLVVYMPVAIVYGTKVERYSLYDGLIRTALYVSRLAAGFVAV